LILYKSLRTSTTSTPCFIEPLNAASAAAGARKGGKEEEEEQEVNVSLNTAEAACYDAVERLCSHSEGSRHALTYHT